MMKGRRIRIIFSDPDATESDSDDDATSSACRKTEMIILQHGNGSGATKKDPDGCDSQAQAIGSSSSASCWDRVTGPGPNRRHRGVYERQPGRWGAEFRNHRLKVRHWVGTFPTEEEARLAYDAFEKRLFSSPRCGQPAPEHGGNAGGVRGASRPPPDEKRQIVLALATTGTGRMLPPAGSVAAASVPPAPCVSSSASSSLPPPFWNVQDHADAPPTSLHSIWADEPADEFVVGLSDLAHLPLPFSGASMDFDPADLSLFDNGFL